MALEHMRDEMLRLIRAKTYSELQVAAYQAAWTEAIQNSGKPLPCPSCFIKGNNRRLKPINEKNGIAVVRCQECRETFEFVNPE